MFSAGFLDVAGAQQALNLLKIMIALLVVGIRFNNHLGYRCTERAIMYPLQHRLKLIHVTLYHGLIRPDLHIAYPARNTQLMRLAYTCKLEPYARVMVGY